MDDASPVHERGHLSPPSGLTVAVDDGTLSAAEPAPGPSEGTLQDNAAEGDLGGDDDLDGGEASSGPVHRSPIEPVCVPNDLLEKFRCVFRATDTKKVESCCWMLAHRSSDEPFTPVLDTLLMG